MIGVYTLFGLRVLTDLRRRVRYSGGSDISKWLIAIVGYAPATSAMYAVSTWSGRNPKRSYIATAFALSAST